MSWVGGGSEHGEDGRWAERDWSLRALRKLVSGWRGRRGGVLDGEGFASGVGSESGQFAGWRLVDEGLELAYTGISILSYHEEM